LADLPCALPKTEPATSGLSAVAVFQISMLFVVAEPLFHRLPSQDPRVVADCRNPPHGEQSLVSCSAQPIVAGQCRGESARAINTQGIRSQPTSHPPARLQSSGCGAATCRTAADSPSQVCGRCSFHHHHSLLLSRSSSGVVSHDGPCVGSARLVFLDPTLRVAL
jgi:hypothetical protein